MNIVICDGQNRAVIEQRQHHNHDGRQRIEIENQNRQRHEEQHAQRLSDAINRVTVHPLENPPALLDRVNDHRQTGREQHDGCRRARRVGRTGNGYTAICLLQCGCVVHSVARHANDVVVFLQDIHNVEFVFGKYLGKSIRLLDGLDHRRRLLLFRVAERFGIENIRAHPQRLRHLLRNRYLIARHHLDLHAHGQRGRNRRLRILARWIEHGQHTEKLPRPVALGPRHAQ